MMADSTAQYNPIPSQLYVYVDNVDHTYKRGLEAGGISEQEPTTQFYGDRTAAVKDPTGNFWWIATHIEDVSPEEMERRMKHAPHRRHDNPEHSAPRLASLNVFRPSSKHDYCSEGYRRPDTPIAGHNMACEKMEGLAGVCDGGCGIGLAGLTVSVWSEEPQRVPVERLFGPRCTTPPTGIFPGLEP